MAKKKRIINSDLTGFECAGLTTTFNNSFLINQWKFHWTNLEDIKNNKIENDYYSFNDFKKDLSLSSDLTLESNLKKDKINYRKLFPKIRVGGECLVNIFKNPFDKNYKTVKVSTSPFSGGYGMRGGVILEDNEIFIPLSDVPNYKKIFSVRSKDNGHTWTKAQLVAEDKNKEFEEPAIIILPNGSLFMLLRENKSKIIHSIYSKDNGITWSKPKKTKIIGYPSDLIVLEKNLIACVTGNRNRPYQILIYLSENLGKTWEKKIVLSNNLHNKDLGYPTIARRKNGDIVVIYYAQNNEYVTSIYQKTITFI